MAKSTIHPRVWKRIAPALGEMDAASLRALVHNLYQLAPENRAFLAAWIGDEDALGECLQAYKKQISGQFYSRTWPRLQGGCDFGLCKRLIQEYRRITTSSAMVGGFDVRGTIDLSLHLIEVGTQYVNDIGWHAEEPYEQLTEVADGLSELIRTPGGQRWAGSFQPRVRAVAEVTNGFGYGYGDALSDMAQYFEDAAASFQRKQRRP